ncbi:unnamed protein product [Chondrus crispus]|uniref:Uncharacterized protein n=1 Tax=Chondrus crispus TaxID=2769 RepID=R7QSM8_CHOCR|nr:unnamed protein product [Chondrus crispus]CDF40753.1 unnamed protein product [Chondrus crispus]|eukprot:XP_005711047.1 unnamed protein product [Chondrus crispus]
MDSRFRSNTNPALLEARRLRQEKDVELARSLQEDRKRNLEEQSLAAAKRAAEKTQKLVAVVRLPDELLEDSVEALTSALRVAGGARIARRFSGRGKLRSVADS